MKSLIGAARRRRERIVLDRPFLDYEHDDEGENQGEKVSPRPGSNLEYGSVALLLFWFSLWLCPGSQAATLMGQGITEPIHDVILSPSVAGIVNVWKFKEGAFVNEGEVIIELDKELEELETARRRLVVENRKKEWEALKTLADKSSISVKKEELEKAETEYRIAQVEHDIALEQLRRRSIRMPCAGFIVEITHDPGEACQPYQPLARVVDTRRCYFVSNIEAKTAGKLRQGQPVNLEIETAGGSAAVKGNVVFLSPVVDAASGLRKVKVLFENADGKINPGVAGKMYLD